MGAGDTTSKVLKMAGVFLVSFIVMCAISPLRGGYLTVFKLTGIPLSMVAYAVGYFFVTIFFLKKHERVFPGWLVVVALLLGASLADVYARFIRENGFETSLISLPDFSFRILAIFCGLLYYKISNKWQKSIVAVTFSLFVLWGGYHGFGLWLNKVSYGTCTGVVSQELDEPLRFYRADGTSVSTRDLKEDYVILDFWNSVCGACFRSFPVVQEMSDEYQGGKVVGIYGVHCWNAETEDFKTGDRILSSKNHTFPCLAADGQALKALGIDAFPYVLILDRDRTIIFRGSIEGARKRIKMLIGR